MGSVLEIVIVPDVRRRKKRYRFRGGLIEKFAVVAETAYHDMNREERERKRAEDHFTRPLMLS